MQPFAFIHFEIYIDRQPVAYKKNLKLITEGKILVWETAGFVQVAIKAPNDKEYASVERELKVEFNRAEKEFYAKYPIIKPDKKK